MNIWEERAARLEELQQEYKQVMARIDAIQAEATSIILMFRELNPFRELDPSATQRAAPGRPLAARIGISVGRVIEQARRAKLSPEDARRKAIQALQRYVAKTGETVTDEEAVAWIDAKIKDRYNL